MARMTITLPQELKDKVDKYNEETYMAKSSIVALALDQFFQNREIMQNMKDVPAMMEKLSELGNIIQQAKENGMPIELPLNLDSIKK